MYSHHEESILNITRKLKTDKEILAVLIGGSVAHGFAKEDSDIDIMLVISEADYLKRVESKRLHYFETEDCTYEGGYVDGKYMSVEFLEKAARQGSEPARFAFKNAICTYSAIKGIEELLTRITTYPKATKHDKISAFYAQLQAWRWYCHEALKHSNTYLLNHSVSNLILFGGRLILAYNETLYPYHKWFLRVLSEVLHKPDNLMENINALLESQTKENVEKLFECVNGFADWDMTNGNWPNRFMLDSELNWLNNTTPVGDL